jgi:hypothetical protein
MEKNMHRFRLGIYSYYLGGKSYTGKGNVNDSGLVANNQISIGTPSSSGAPSIGIQAYYGYQVNYYHNTIDVQNTSTGTNNTAMYVSAYTTTQYTTIMNNVFSNSGGGYAIYIGSTTGLYAIDYNDYYSTT